MTDRLPPFADEPCSAGLWEALRYLSGELSAEEVARFEDRLGEDLEAAESLARAVMLCEALPAADSVAAPRSAVPPVMRTDRSPVHSVKQPARQRPLHRPGRWIGAVSTVACAAGLLALGWFTSDPSRAPRFSPLNGVSLRSGAPPADTSMLSLWVSLDTTRGHSKEEAIVEETVEDSADEASVETVAETPAETNVPDWMFAALLTSSDPARGMPETLPPGLDADTEGSL